MKYTNQSAKLIIAISLSLLTTVSYADWGVRLGTDNSNKQYNMNKNEINALLSLKYQGDKFNMGKGGISYDLTNSEEHAIELLLTSKNRGFDKGDDKLFNGMSNRKASIDVGVRGIIDTGYLGKAVVDVTRDVSTSKGVDVGVKLGGISPHASHWTGKKSMKIAAAGGFRYQSAKVVDYFYGVKKSEATANRKAYKAKSALTPYIGVEAQANLTKHITFDGGLNVSKKAKSVRNSPLTKNNKYQLGANLGVSYWF